MDNQPHNSENDYEELMHRIHMGDMKAALREMHPADIADVLSNMPEEDLGKVFKHLDPKKAGTVLDEASPEVQKDLIEAIDEDKLAGIINNLPPDEQADIMGSVDEDMRDRIMSRLDAESTSDIEELLQYESDTAGGMMTTEVIALPAQTPVKSAIAIWRKMAGDSLEPFIYVVNKQKVLTGVVSDKKLLIASDMTRLDQIMSTEVDSVNVNTDQQEVAQLFRKYDLISMPVVDDNNVLKGVITVDDVLEVIRDENSEDFYRMAGSGERDPFHESMLQKSSKRLPWLLITLVGGIVAAGIMENYASDSKFIRMAIFIPVIMATAGNVAIQSATILVRGFALGEAKRYKLFSHLLREVGVGIIVGMVCSILCGVAAAIMKGDPSTGIAISVSMMCAITVAACNGVVIPLACNSIGIDPAIVSGPFITILNDVLGIAIYLSIGSLLLT
jgi:magnesium transporter